MIVMAEQTELRNEVACMLCGHDDGVNAEGLCNHRHGGRGDALPNLCNCKCVFPEPTKQSDEGEK